MHRVATDTKSLAAVLTDPVQAAAGPPPVCSAQSSPRTPPTHSPLAGGPLAPQQRTRRQGHQHGGVKGCQGPGPGPCQAAPQCCSLCHALAQPEGGCQLAHGMPLAHATYHGHHQPDPPQGRWHFPRRAQPLLGRHQGPESHGPPTPTAHQCPSQCLPLVHHLPPWAAQWHLRWVEAAASETSQRRHQPRPQPPRQAPQPWLAGAPGQQRPTWSGELEGRVGHHRERLTHSG